MMKLKTVIWFMVAAVIAATILLGLWALGGLKDEATEGVMEMAEGGGITDCHGESWPSNDSVILPAIRQYYHLAVGGENGSAGRHVTLTLDAGLQALGTELLEGKRGSIVAIEPGTGEVLCLVASPSPEGILKPYTPGGVFKVAQSLVLQTEHIITPQTYYPCEKGFRNNHIVVGCHGHASPLALADAMKNACNGYFCHGFVDMIGNAKYGTKQQALEVWREHILSMGLGRQLGTDLPHETRGLIPSAEYYDKAYNGGWNALTILNVAVGQGEIMVTPLQLANLAATIANRGYYMIPHLVKEIQGVEIDARFTERQTTKISPDAYEPIIQSSRMKHATEVWGISGAPYVHGVENSTFMGFAPIDEPKIAVAAYIEDCGMGAKPSVVIGEQMMERFLNDE